MKDMMQVYGVAAAVDAAGDAGLLAALLEAPATASALADRLALDARATEQVLAILVALGAARREGDRFDGTPALETFLAAEHRTASRALFAHVPAWLETGVPVRVMSDTGERESTYRHVTPGLGRMFRAGAESLASALPRTPRAILDVGCGSGIWSLALAERHPQARVTGLDLPGVLDGFRAFAAEMGLADRVGVLAGDVHELALPAAAFDLVVIANVLRIESPERARHIIDRIAPTVTPEGAVLVVDALGGGTPERDLAREVYAMHLALRSRDGRVHAPERIRGWLAAAGFPSAATIDFESAAASVGALLFTR